MVKYWCERKTGINVEEFDKEGLFTFLERTKINILITGPGGTGKSTSLKKFKEKTAKIIASRITILTTLILVALIFVPMIRAIF